MKKYLLLLTIIFLSSCSLFEDDNIAKEGNKKAIFVWENIDMPEPAENQPPL